ncbi:MAG TPA: GNAT family N-acetyltransferase [Gemmatimonadales bacterium]|nr:GNAT family N-acetyltransferase [Gemmatimonadales bacterium]
MARRAAGRGATAGHHRRPHGAGRLTAPGVTTEGVRAAGGPIIRRAAIQDAVRLAELSSALGYPAAAETITARLERLLQRADDVIFVAEVPASRVVGWLHGAEQELLESGRRCEILGLVVDAAHRGRGIGRLLVAAVETWAGARGLALVAVRSNVKRSESHPFYERLGYVKVKTQHAYRKRLSEPAS